jgi:hypothetical protein
MAIANKDDLIETSTLLLGGAASSLATAALEAAADQAISETVWGFPTPDGVKSYWLIERTRRHILQVLANVAAMKFQYKQIHLEHRYKHLSALISSMDTLFLAFVEENPELFAAAFVDLDADTSGYFTYITNGFYYDITGIEL